MLSRVLSTPRLLGLALVLCWPGRLAAAFELSGEWPVGLAKSTATVSRESLENRAGVTVATAPVGPGPFRLQIASSPGLFTLQIGDASIPFVAADGQALRAVVAANGKDLRVEGGPDQTLYAAYEAFRTESLGRKVMPVREANRASRDAGNAAEVDRLTEREVTAYLEHRRELNDFTLERLKGSAALYAASLRWDGDYRLDELASAVQDYEQRFPGNEIGRLMQERVSRFRATAIGARAPVLAGASPTGTKISLVDLRGRYVLVDFWASWCAPCRVENRHYAELHRQYREAGFEILAVSVDQNERAWKAAIAKDGANWLQISDLSGWKTPLAGAYNVTALPASFLLDPSGRIVAKDLRGAPLADRLRQLLENPRKGP